MKLGSILFFGLALLFFFGYAPLKAYHSSVHASCISYDGSTKLRVIGWHKNNGKKEGVLDFERGPYAYLHGNIEYADSKVYEGAEELTGNEKGMTLTIMPDRMHGIVEIWKNRQGEVIIMSEFIPVLCFETKE